MEKLKVIIYIFFALSTFSCNDPIPTEGERLAKNIE